MLLFMINMLVKYLFWFESNYKFAWERDLVQCRGFMAVNKPSVIEGKV